MNYSPRQLKILFDKYNFKLKKRYGQNFIIDKNVIEAIVKKTNLDNETLVIEIGPGSGALTNKLAKTAKNVIAYEIDINLKEILEENLKNYNNVEIVYQDFLKVDLLSDLKKYNYKKLYVVANLPYYITTPIIMKLLNSSIDINKIIVMVQKEIGQRLRAKPGTRDYNSLSVLVSYFYDVKKVLDINKNVFIPKPNVESVVVELKKKDNLLPLKNRNLFFKLVKDSFRQKRKTIKNNLKEYDLIKIEETLKNHNLNLISRAEQVPMGVFVEIANNLNKNNSKKEISGKND